MTTLYTAAWGFVGGELQRNVELLVSDEGVVLAPGVRPATRTVALGEVVLLPGFVNGHSHAFQRAIRGRTEFLAPGHERDDFWSWREAMYQAANALDPEQLYVVSRQAFVEMALAGVTTVGEFHYLQHQPDGTPYDDVSLLAKQVIRAAREVGLRITLLRVGYERAGFQVAPNPRQRRFIDPTVDDYLQRVEALRAAVKGDPLVSVGFAPHSVRAVSKRWLEGFAAGTQSSHLPVHAHVAEQPGEIAASLSEHGRRPVELLEQLGLLHERFTAVHAIHLEATEVTALGRARATVCACPSTERNLGDGIVRADELLAAGASVSLGSDSQAHIDLLGEAQMLEGHLRLLRLKRNVLHPADARQTLAARLVGSLSFAGARSLGLPEATLATGSPADFVALDLRHPSVVGATRVLDAAVMGAASAAVRHVVVAGRQVVRDGQHPLAEEAGTSFTQVVSALG